MYCDRCLSSSFKLIENKGCEFCATFEAVKKHKYKEVVRCDGQELDSFDYTTVALKPRKEHCEHP